jgi:cell fate (sporulation/competence/biofilm development) regulator YlbF (YheA/YmcA/DUF963 family)
MMSIHDQAHALARTLKESPEYREYVRLKEEASQNEELAAMLNDFQARQFELQTRQMLGGAPDQDLIGQVQSLSQIIMKDPLAFAYIQAMQRFSLLVNDVYAILGEVIQFDRK